MAFPQLTPFGPKGFNNIYGQSLEQEAQTWIVKANQTLSSSGAPTTTTMLPGTVVGVGSGAPTKVVIVNSSASDGSQTPIGVYIDPAIETANGDQPGAIARCGSFDLNSLVFKSPDTYSTFATKLATIGIYGDLSQVAPSPTANE